MRIPGGGVAPIHRKHREPNTEGRHEQKDVSQFKLSYRLARCRFDLSVSDDNRHCGGWDETYGDRCPADPASACPGYDNRDQDLSDDQQANEPITLAPCWLLFLRVGSVFV